MAKPNFTFNCPACGSAMPGAVCDRCGYVRIIFPRTLPEAVSRFESDRVEAIKKILAEGETHRQESARQAEARQRELERCKAELDGSRKDGERTAAELSECRGELGRVRAEAQNLRSENRSLASDLDAARSCAERERSSRTSLERSVTGLNMELQEAKIRADKELRAALELVREKERLRKEISRLRAEVSSLSSRPEAALTGVVIIEDVRHDIRVGLPVFDGVNTYGSDPDKSNNGAHHHQIRFVIRGYSFRPVHFTVRSSAKGLVLEAAPGVELFQNGGPVHSGIYARQADNFMLGDKVRLNISPV